MTYYITTAISYPNGSPHIGHAYEAILADAYARYHRLRGEKVIFQTGTDEHGLKIMRTAEANGLTPKEFVDEMAGEFKSLADRLDISYDRFIRTTEAEHYAACQEIWRRMEANGDIYLGTYEGWYCAQEECWLTDKELQDPAWAEKKVEWTEEKTYFFRLAKYRDWLLAYIESYPDFIQPESARNEIINLLQGGLENLSISRSTFTWGVPVPNSDHVMYVWVDALTNYLTGAGFPNDYNNVWPADLHVIGKDITRFHTIFWPAFLQSAGIPLPKRVLAHGFLMHNGRKMSKSEGNVVDPLEEIDRYGSDGLRYYLLRQMPATRDGDYRDEGIVETLNSELANTIGNLAQRTLSMIHKNCGGAIPNENGSKTEADIDLMGKSSETVGRYHEAMLANEADKGLACLVELAMTLNKYLADEQPWATRKENPARANAVLFNVATNLRRLAIALQPFTPRLAEKLLDQLGQTERGFDQLLVDLKPGTVLPPPEVLFPRIEYEAA